NAKARISIPFGTALTQMAELPKGSDRALRDPYADKPVVWPWVVLLLVLLAGGYHAWNSGMFSPTAAEAPAEVVAPAQQ
ncbi:MAG: hypothetical protein EP327_08355, partial [Pseudomonadales bacterium]